jgi:hypothetical protein
MSAKPTEKPSRVGSAKRLMVRGRMESEIASKKELILGGTKHDDQPH